MEFNSEIVSAFCGIVATFAIVKYQSGETKKQLGEHEHDNKRLAEAVFKRLDEHGEAIVALRTKQESTITAKEVADGYVSKELFRQFEKHIDSRSVSQSVQVSANHLQRYRYR